MSLMTAPPDAEAFGFDPALAAKKIEQVTVRGEHTVVLGAGNNTRCLLEAAGAELRESLRAVLDDDPKLAGTTIAGVFVSPPEAYPIAEVRRVIIASETFQRELTERARELFGTAVSIVYGFDRHASPAGRLDDTFELLRTGWPVPCPDAVWHAGDRLREALDERLRCTPNWRYGPQRQAAEFEELCAALPADFTWRGARFYNFGCGRYVPHGQSLLALLAGASATLATDVCPPLDRGRAARALRELAMHAILRPTRMGAARQPRAELAELIERVLDLDRLAEGTYSNALDPHLLAYRTESVYEADLPRDAFELIASRAVFEHLPDVPAALTALHRTCRAGGYLYLIIDYSDHRRYQNPERYHHWSHLIDLDEATYLQTNRLRHPDYPELFAAAGFAVVSSEPCDVEAVPEDEWRRLAPRYRAMPRDELAVASARIVLRRS